MLHLPVNSRQEREHRMDEVAELDQLRAENAAALSRIMANGKQVNGLREHYMLVLLEWLCADELVHLKVTHERWVATQLATAEREITSRRLQVPGPPRNGRDML